MGVLAVLAATPLCAHRRVAGRGTGANKLSGLPGLIKISVTKSLHESCATRRIVGERPPGGAGDVVVMRVAAWPRRIARYHPGDPPGQLDNPSPKEGELHSVLKFCHQPPVGLPSTTGRLDTNHSNFGNMDLEIFFLWLMNHGPSASICRMNNV